MKTDQRHKAANQPARERRQSTAEAKCIFSLSPAEIDQLRDSLAEPFLAHTDREPHTVYNCIGEGMELAKMTPPIP